MMYKLCKFMSFRQNFVELSAKLCTFSGVNLTGVDCKQIESAGRNLQRPLTAAAPRSASTQPHLRIGWRSGSRYPGAWLRVRVSKIGKFCKICKFLAGSFSAVSKRNFARKYAFDSIFQALQDLHPFAPLQSQNFSKKSV